MSLQYPSVGPGCTCGSCPVHGKPGCPACGARGAHYCPGPPSLQPPQWYGNGPACPCGKTGPHTCITC